MSTAEGTARYRAAKASFAAAHAQDPAGESASYHQELEAYVRKLSPAPASEPLLLAANCQHIRRWEKPRSDFPVGLSAYKTWRVRNQLCLGPLSKAHVHFRQTQLNKFHATVAEKTLLSSGYDAEADAELIQRVKDLLLKKGLARPPLVPPFNGKLSGALERYQLD
jgi:hypothetical protein